MSEPRKFNGNKLSLIPARQGIAAIVRSGQRLTVVNTYGTQVIDTWAFNAHDPSEFMSMEHSRTATLKLVPKVGDSLVTNRRNPILTMVADTSPGVHDTLVAACDCHRYRQLGAKGYHHNCTDNLSHALDEIGIETVDTPAPFNLFMNVPVDQAGALEFLPPVSQPGQYVTFRAEMDLLAVFSACPQDMTPVNGLTPTDAHFLIEDFDFSAKEIEIHA